MDDRQHGSLALIRQPVKKKTPAQILTMWQKGRINTYIYIYILLYGCTTWTLTKRLEKKLDGNYTRMLRAILNKSWRQHPTRRQLYDHLPPITKTIQVRWARHAGHCWRSKDELVWVYIEVILLFSFLWMYLLLSVFILNFVSWFFKV